MSYKNIKNTIGSKRRPAASWRVGKMIGSSVMLILLATKLLALENLKDAFLDDFRIGAALNPGTFTGSNAGDAAIVKAQFNTISPENVLKWESIQPRPREFDFGDADRYVQFGLQNKMFIVGHNLIWHQQTPGWVFQDKDGNLADPTLLLARMRYHIFTVVGRYRGKIGGWDVVNEALNDDGSMRNTPWRKILGDDYLVKAYQFAHEADPHVELYYNDYSLENPAKRKGAVALIKRLQAAGVPIAAIGLQEHDSLDWPPSSQVDETISDFSALGIKVMITELDVDVLPSASQFSGANVSLRVAQQKALNPYALGLPDSVQQKLAQRYAELFAVFVKHRHKITRVTFWGVTDADSWLNDWPVDGRTSYPLLFGRDFQPKPAFAAVIATAHQAKHD